MGNETMYTSYAKDIFIALLNKSEKEDENIFNLMERAIDLVKSAKDAFSD